MQNDGQDRPSLGIMLMIGFCAAAPLGDAIAKVLGDTIPLLQLLVVRFAAQALILLPLALLGGHSFRMTRRVFWLTAARTLLHIVGIGVFFTALRFLPLADAVAIAYVMPFIMLLLGRLVLGEMVGVRRIMACVVGFGGTLLVIQPSFAEVGWPALLPLVVAVVFALYMLVSRQLARDNDPMVLQAVAGVMALAVLGVIVLFTRGIDIQPLSFVTPTSRDLWLLAGIGTLGTFAHLLMTWSLRFAPSATLAPMQYLEIPFATFIGWLVFHDLPNGLAAIGIAVTMGSGLYIVWRERATTRPLPPQT
ncbi:MAG: DMT family transporter [Rhizobiaceae bacterium]|nr:DMT family transporter [Rhizobiaceae bacterium]